MDFTDNLDILYARRSSEDGKDGESIENQVALFKQYVADKSIGKIAECDQKDRQLDILFKEDLLEIPVCKAKIHQNKCIKA